MIAMVTQHRNPINNLNQSLDNFVRAADGGGQVFKAGVTGSLMSLRFADTMCGSSVSFNIRDYVGLGNPYGGAVLASGTASENTWGTIYFYFISYTNIKC